MAGDEAITILALKQRIAELEAELQTANATRQSPIYNHAGLFAYFVDNVNSHVFIKDRDGRYIFINRMTEELFGIRREELGDRVYTDRDFFTEPAVRAIRANDRQVMESGEAIESEEGLRAKNSTDSELAEHRYYMALKFPLKDETGAVIGLCGFSHDITRLKQAEAALKASEERFRQLSDAALEGILFHDNGIILQANQTLARMLGYPHTDDLVGKSIVQFVAPESQPVIQEKMQNYSPKPYEIEGLRADGSQFPMEVVTRAGVHQGAMARVVVVRDISERRLAEQQRLAFEREQERAAVLQYFISDASHDLRTPLTTIKTSLHLLPYLQNDAVKRERHLAIMKEQTEQLERLLEHMLHMTRLDMMTTFHFASVNVNTLIEIIFEAQQGSAERKDQELHFLPGPNVSPIQADMRQLNRGLTSIVENAIQYTGERGTIILQTYQQGDEVVVQVQDSGIGIGEADLPRIYDRFFRADPARNLAAGGAGLGLAIAKKIIDAHHGRIDVESVLGQGSTFYVRLPAQGDT